MKTIAITIDTATLEKVDQLAELKGMNRSELIRTATQDYIAEKQKEIEEEHERRIFRRHNKKLKQQALALIREQAEP